MKKKILAVFLSLCMAMSLLPVTALAAEGEGTISSPKASGDNFFANGTPITISKTAPDGTDVTSEYKTEFTATGTSAYISWDDDGMTQYVGVSNAVSVWGGADGSSRPVSVASTSITMTGGTVKNILGGNLGQESKTQDGCSSVTGNVDISITGGSVTKLIYGGGENNTCVKGTVTITLEDVKLGATCYVNGGVLGHGTEGDRNIEAGTMTTHAVVTKVIINATDSTAYVLGGGGSGSTKVKEAIVTLNGCTVANLYASGINGEMEKSSLKATDCTVTGELAATNRGFIKTADVTLEACEISQLMTGATTGCFGTDSGKPDGSGITGSIVWKIDEQTTVDTASLTPLAKRDAKDQTTATLDNITIEKSGAPLEISVAEFKPHSEASVNTFLVSESGTLTLNNVKATVESGQTLTNAGTINMDDDSSLTVDSGATLQQAGTVNGGDVKVEGEGTFTEYVARVGNTGYESLADALNAVATNGGTITLLQNATLKADITISKNITIDGQGKYKIDAKPAKDHAITVAPGGALTLKDVTLNITDEENQIGTYGLDVQYGATLTLNNAEIDVSGVSNATISASWGSTSKEPGKFILNNSKITATDIGGNFSNGGDWALTNSSIEIEDCASNGFSCNSATLDNSTVSVSGAQLMGVTAKEITLENDSAVTVKECGTDLPKASKWATDDESYKHPVEIKKGGKVTIDSTSSMTLQNNVKGNNTVYFVESTMDNDGTLQANVRTKAPTGSFSVTVKNGNSVLDVATVASGETYTLPAALSDYGYNHFQGWNDGTTTYAGGTKVIISKNTTFTAVWSYIPPANPNYRIDIPAAEGGTVTADPAAAKAGATVTLTATPDEGYAVGTIIVTDRFGDAVKVTENADGTYTFTMPNGQVTVKATFVETEEPAPAMPFTDVKEGDWFYDEVLYVYENGLMNGVGDNRFAPNSATTRGMLVTILYRLEGEPDVTGEAGFSDVGDTWYTDAVIWAAANDIVNGIGDNQFGPENTLTREQLVTMLYRYAQNKGYDVTASADLSGYPDAGQIQSWAQEAMTWAVAEGIVEGMDGNLNPAGSATRAQIATILMRFCEGVAK